MSWLKKTMLYAGEEKEVYFSIKNELRESSRKNLIVFTLIAFAAMLVMFFSSFFESSLAKNRLDYLLSAAVCLVLSGTAHLAKRYPKLTYIGVYAFLAILFSFGIALGTFIEPNEMTVSFVILLFVAPLLFTDSPIRMSAAILTGALAYVPAALITQDAILFRMNLTDVAIYSVLSIVVSSYMMLIKVGRIRLEQANDYLSHWDVLTGLKNRRSFEEDLKTLNTSGQHGHLICAFDVNGLKTVNDKLGHAAGDELLQGAADCIRSVFGSHGTCYRIGGDEFMAILPDSRQDTGALLDAFRKRTKGWSGKLVPSLSVSVGMIAMQPGDNIDVVLTRADQQMYADKSLYYSSKKV